MTFDDLVPAERISYEKVILFLDYDGTLRDFEDEPLAAIPSEALLQLLQGLADLKEHVKVRTRTCLVIMRFVLLV